MRNKQARYLIVLTAILVLVGCNRQADSTTTSTEVTATSAEQVERVAGKYGKYSEKDLVATTTDSAKTQIVLKDNATTVTGEGVTVKDNTITITTAGTYEISGSLSDGQVIVAADKENDDVKLFLNGVSVTNKTTSPFYVATADKVIVTLAADSQNKFVDGKEYDFEEGADEPDATIFSTADLTFNGTGELEVVGNYKDGIRSKDDLVFVSGNYKVTAANNGLKGTDSVSILDGEFQITAKNDGIQASKTEDETLGWVAIDDGQLTIVADHDGIQAETALTVGSGTMAITTGGGAEKAATKTQTGFGGMGVPNGGADPSLTGERPEMVEGEKPDMGNRQQPTEEASATEANEVSDVDEETETTASDSAKGLKAGTTLQIDKGQYTLDTVDDSLHGANVTILNGDLTIASGDDGIHADETTTINNGTIDITESYEGIEGGTIVLAGGTISVTSADDGINAGSSVVNEYLLNIKGGTISVNAEGDGLDSNGDVIMTGGTVVVDGPVSGGNGALDYDGTFKQTGGTLVATDSGGMSMATSSESEQPALSVTFDSSQKAGNLVNLSDEQGKSILTYSPAKAYQQILISSLELKVGSSYHLATGGKDTGTNQGGLYNGGTYTGTSLLEVSLDEMITSISESGEAVSQNQMGGPGGGEKK